MAMYFVYPVKWGLAEAIQNHPERVTRVATHEAARSVADRHKMVHGEHYRVDAVEAVYVTSTLDEVLKEDAAVQS